MLMSPNGRSGADQAQRRENSPPPAAKVEGTRHHRAGACLTWPLLAVPEKPRFPHVDTCFPTGLYNKVLFFL